MMSIKFISIYIQISPKESTNKLNYFWVIVSFFSKFDSFVKSCYGFNAERQKFI